MRTSNYELGDINLVSLRIKSVLGGNDIDIRGQVITFSIYEDIYEPTVYAEFVVQDSINLIGKLPIVGEEEITVKFTSPFRDKETIYKLKVFSVNNKVINTTGTSAAYVIRAVSAEHFSSANVVVENGYKDSISNIVIDILKNKIKSKKTVAIEDTKGIVNLIIPKMQGLQAIDFLKMRAVSKAPTGGVYVFFENQYGFQFKSIEQLIEEEKTVSENRIFRALPGVNTNKESRNFQFRNIINFQHLTSFDTYRKTQSGTLSNKVKVFDLKTKKYNDVEFKLSQQKSKIPYASTKSSINNSDQFISENESGGQRYFIATDSSRPNDFVGDMLGYRTAFFSLFNESMVRVEVHGDSQLAAGMMVKLELPDASGVEQTEKSDPLHSGNYLITRLRHIVYLEERKFKHSITFDCNKLGLK